MNLASYFHQLRQWMETGGPIAVLLLLLCALLYGLASYFLIRNYQKARAINQWVAYSPSYEARLQAAHLLKSDSRSARLLLGALVAAAPLLGLLGTVSGMAVTFSALASESGKEMDLLAKGISEVLTATEAGLAIALPGLLIMYLLHRQTQNCLEALEVS